MGLYMFLKCEKCGHDNVNPCSDRFKEKIKLNKKYEYELENIIKSKVESINGGHTKKLIFLTPNKYYGRNIMGRFYNLMDKSYEIIDREPSYNKRTETKCEIYDDVSIECISYKEIKRLRGILPSDFVVIYDDVIDLTSELFQTIIPSMNSVGTSVIFLKNR